ncbi:MAG: mechanosensitive ion channel domain-containing protein [Ilumatobacteraceae bacterium]
MNDAGDVALNVLWVAIVITIASIAWWLIAWLTTRRPERREELSVRRQLLHVAIVVVAIVAVVLVLPIEPELKGALIGVVGITMAAILGLSATSMVGNALAGLMLRSVRNFKIGDFLSVEGHFGRVTYRRLMATEIQTEDRDLTTLPNQYLVTHPVKVIHASGTVVSTTVSIGYDVHRLTLQPVFEEAAIVAGLTEPFVQVHELGDYSVTYRIAGFLDEVTQLLTVRAKLRAAVFDRLSAAGIEIASPMLVGRRPLDPEEPLIADRPRARRAAAPRTDPAKRIFDKAEAAAAVEELDTATKRLAELEQQRAECEDDEIAELDREIAATTERLDELTELLAEADPANGA